MIQYYDKQGVPLYVNVLVRQPTGRVVGEAARVTEDGIMLSEKTHYRDDRLFPFLAHLCDGGIVVDQATFGSMSQDDLHTLMSMSPLPDSTLDEGEVVLHAAPENLDDLPIALRAMLDTEGKYEGLPHALDGLSFGEWWHEFGARVGIRSDDTILWFDGVSSPTRVPTFGERLSPNSVDAPAATPRELMS